jgi:hypothetical protein
MIPVQEKRQKEVARINSILFFTYMTSLERLLNQMMGS